LIKETANAFILLQNTNAFILLQNISISNEFCSFPFLINPAQNPEKKCIAVSKELELFSTFKIRNAS